MEPKAGFEPATSSLPRMRSTPELLGLMRKTYGAGDETRTRDIQLGRLTLYQLSYSRPLRFGIADLGLRIVKAIAQLSQIRNPNSQIRNQGGAWGRI